MRMVRRSVGVIILTVAAAACADSPITGGDDSAPLPLGRQNVAEQVVAGEVIVKMKPGQDISGVMRDLGVAGTIAADVLAAEPGSSAMTVIRGEAGQERALAARLSADPRVQYAEPNFLRQPHTVRSELWAFVNAGGRTVTFTRGSSKGQVVTSLISKADADEDNIDNSYAAGGTAVVVGSIDTGVDFTHQEFLSGQLIAGRDWISSDNDPTDGDGHGTHTTGTMVGRTVGLAGVSGAGANVKVLVQRVCGPRGCPTTAIVNAIRAAADYPGMVAMNLSLGGSSISQAERDAIAYANSKNVLVIASAGNDGTSTIDCPACDPGAISVAATDWLDERAYYSNIGSGLDIAAPGGELYSNTTSQGGIFSSVPGGYAFYQGTSMAAPQVTGTAGIVASKNGSLRGASLRSRILGTTDPVNIGQSVGRLNSYRAVTNTSLGSGL